MLYQTDHEATVRKCQSLTLLFWKQTWKKKINFKTAQQCCLILCCWWQSPETRLQREKKVTKPLETFWGGQRGRGRETTEARVMKAKERQTFGRSEWTANSIWRSLPWHYLLDRLQRTHTLSLPTQQVVSGGHGSHPVSSFFFPNHTKKLLLQLFVFICFLGERWN